MSEAVAEAPPGEREGGQARAARCGTRTADRAGAQLAEEPSRSNSTTPQSRAPAALCKTSV